MDSAVFQPSVGYQTHNTDTRRLVLDFGNFDGPAACLQLAQVVNFLI